MFQRAPDTFDLQQGFNIEPEFAIAKDGTLFSVATASINFEDRFLFTRYASDGTVIFENSILDPRDTSEGASRLIIDLLPLDGGGFVTLFQYGSPTAFRPVIRIHDETGQPVSDFLDVPLVDENGPGNRQDGYSLAASPDGGFSVLVGSDRENELQQTSSDPDFFRRTDVRLIEFNADGSLKRSPFLPHAIEGAGGGVSENQIALSHDAFEDGRILVAYTNSIFGFVPQLNNTVEGHEIRVRIIEDGAVQADIQVFDPPFFPGTMPFSPFPPPAPQPGTGTRDAPSAIVLSDGGFAVAYSLNQQDGDDLRFVQFYDANGAPVGDQVATGLGQGFHEYAATQDGRLLILSDSADVRLLLVDANGVQDEILVETVNGVPRKDGLDVAPDGSIYVSSRDDFVHRFFLDGAALIGDGVAETLTGDADDNFIIGAGGADVLNGLGGDDQLEGGAGDDTLTGGAGANTLLGGDGEDTATFADAFAAYSVSEQADGFVRVEKPGESIDSLSVELFQFSDRILTRAELLNPPEPEEPVDPPAPEDATDGDDFLQGSAGDDSLNGLDGDDDLDGLDGDDFLLGGGGNDRLFGNGGVDTLKGGGGDDNIKGNGGADVIRAGGGDDTVRACGGDDNINGNGGADVIRGGGGSDNVRGGGGNDLILGGGGADILSGGGGGDTLRGNGGDDMLRGNGGADIFQFRTSDRNDTILDFRQGQDKIHIQSGARNFETLSIEQDGRDVLIGFGAGNVRVVTDRVDAFGEDDFIF